MRLKSINVLIIGIFLFGISIASPAYAALAYVEHFDTDGSLGGWNVWGTNWQVDDSVLELYPLGTCYLYIYSYTGIPWPNVDFHVGIKAGDYSIRIQLWVDTWNGTDYSDAFGSIYIIEPSQGWRDVSWDEDDLQDAIESQASFGNTYNLTDVEFCIWDPSDNGDSCFIDYIGTFGSDWSDEVQDEIDSQQSTTSSTTTPTGTTITSTSTSTDTSPGGGGVNPFQVSGSGDPLTTFLAWEYTIVQGLLSGNTSDALISIGLMLLQGALLTGLILWLWNRGKKK